MKENISTRRLYLEDDYCFETEAVVLAPQENSLAFDRTCFYPGGGGQPADQGTVQTLQGTPRRYEIVSAHADAGGVIWHACECLLPVDLTGQAVKLALNRERRLAFMAFHTALHVLNTIALRDYGAWITGVQIHTDYSRIDFKWEGFAPALGAELETKVNRVLEEDHQVKSYTITEEEFRQRGDLLRTLEVQPPVVQGRVRVVEIEGFDAQACGGTHVARTSAAGRCSIFRTENKGRINKRFYVRLA